ncbi:hypothetical protein IOQ59_07285 [Pontibacterium sp. N1Y112]|uniref:SIR2-like domain-containing protein n=1 Tax=Pontibacterium sinense TaxID=2781979 RepID=A0A8J7JYZ5_9GAMM|nr:hypothetical protein [Pontibacterium sinense]MBE9397064.1 hypothetical protein [Pontibacterium sinense]
MSIVFLFGAGASAFSGECSREPPPLGNELFDRLVKIGSPASELNDKYGETFRKDFEAGMREIASNEGALAIPLLRQIGKYLGSIEVRSGNTYCEFIKEIQPYLNEVCLATLNYDCLLEQALSILNIDFSLKPFCTDDVGPSLLKLHGSSNWLPVIPENLALSNVVVSNPEMALVSGVTKACYASSTEAIEKWHEEERFSSLAPIMCNYAEGKNCMVNPEVVAQVQEFWVNTIAQVKLVVLVGVRYISEDTQVWDCIEASECELAVINPDKNEVLQLNTRFPTKNVRDIGNGFSESMPAIVEMLKNGI